MATDQEVGRGVESGADEPTCVTIALSGGGYRATAFTAGALLAVADSSLRDRVVSVNSVSGGSIASAGTVGGFAEPDATDPDPMGSRVRLLAGLVQSHAIRTEAVLGYGLSPFLVVGLWMLVFFIAPDWRTLEDPTIFFTFVIVIAIGTFGFTAIPESWYAVQGAVESLVAKAAGAASPREGTTIEQIANTDACRRIFCATDLGSGSHVYLTHDRVLTSDQVGGQPNVYVADVVAASACFPGFRPIVFGRGELGLQSSKAMRPRRHHAGGRLLLGTVGIVGGALVVMAVLMRIFGPLNQGWGDFGVAVGILAGGLLLAVLAARILWVPHGLALVDGGVCDNLGAAFALLSEDDRYPDLPAVAGADVPGLMLVIDASKPFDAGTTTWRGVGELIPLRLRGAGRSVLTLLGTANAAARKHVIERILEAGGAFTGAVISITQVPQDSDGLNWPSVVQSTKSTPTTLSPLDVQTVRDLILQSYRLTQSVLLNHGATLNNVRSGKEINALVGGTVPSEVKMVLDEGRGPYARQVRRVRFTVRIVHATFVAVALAFAFWWRLGR